MMMTIREMKRAVPTIYARVKGFVRSLRMVIVIESLG